MAASIADRYSQRSSLARRRPSRPFQCRATPGGFPTHKPPHLQSPELSAVPRLQLQNRLVSPVAASTTAFQHSPSHVPSLFEHSSFPSRDSLEVRALCDLKLV